MLMQTHIQNDTDMRLVRAAILNGTPLPARAVARLEARGVNVGELEARIKQQFFKSAGIF
jgi:hypothetical protein